jgi:hypothetical protein
VTVLDETRPAKDRLALWNEIRSWKREGVTAELERLGLWDDEDKGNPVWQLHAAAIVRLRAFWRYHLRTHDRLQTNQDGGNEGRVWNVSAICTEPKSFRMFASSSIPESRIKKESTALSAAARLTCNVILMAILDYERAHGRLPDANGPSALPEGLGRDCSESERGS